MRPVYNVLVLCLALAAGYPRPFPTLHDPVPNDDDWGLRIWRGDDAKEGEFPFMVRVLFSNMQCGGALITKNVVITAAHCACKDKTSTPLEPSAIQVILGDFSQQYDTNEQWKKISKVIVHSKYNHENLANDIAMLVIDGTIDEKGGAIGTINLPTAAMKSKLYYPGAPITVIGWGGTEKGNQASTLQKLTYNIASSSQCKAFWGDRLHEGNICTHMKDQPLTKHSWGGDSGGPLFHKVGNTTYLLALVSFGVSEPDTKALDVNADVSYYLEWIEKSLKGDGDKDQDKDKDKDQDKDKDKDQDKDKDKDQDKDKDKDQDKDNDKDKDKDKDKDQDKDKDKDHGNKDYQKFKLALKGGSASDGIITVRHPNLTDRVIHTVCNDKFSQNEVMGVCRHLGYKYGKLRGALAYLNDEMMERSLFTFTDLDCQGNATNVFRDCKVANYTATGSNGIPCFTGEQAAVSCSNETFHFNVTLASHRPRFLKGYKLMKVRSVLKVVAKKFGQYVWLQNDVNALIVNVRYDGKVELLADHMMFKRKRNAFVRTSRKEVNFKSADDAKKNTCLATFVYLMHTPGFVVTKIDSRRCGIGAEKAKAAIAQWDKAQQNKTS